ncbi:MAG: SusD/RagB family nutrient-binding outer membrane lipoprotein, partial [Chitinophagaceae bacterium]
MRRSAREVAVETCIAVLSHLNIDHCISRCIIACGGIINQFNFVIANTDATGPLKYYNAIARVMKGWTYQRLVDQYGDVPYSDAGQGVGKLSPKYDTYDAVYKAVYADLDAAI